MTDVERLASLIRRVPVLSVDTRGAQAVERSAALSYSRAIEDWLCEAGNALATLSTNDEPDREGGRVETRQAGEHRPHGTASSELVSAESFTDGLDRDPFARERERQLAFRDSLSPAGATAFEARST